VSNLAYVRSATARPDPGALLEVLHPLTWFPPMWAFTCGAISVGVDLRATWGLVLLGVVVAGPLVCATSQAVNDWFDRHVDAINEPGRPIPSGRLPGRWGLGIALLWTALSAVAGALLGRWGFLATLAALGLAWAYSAPPLRLKRNGWLGNAAVGFSYEGLAWVTGAAVVLGGRLPPAESLLLALLYSLGAHGIMTLNDYKSLEGDRATGIGSLPVRLGAAPAAAVAGATMLLPQLAVILLLAVRGAPLGAAGVALLVLLQLPLLQAFQAAPSRRAAWYSGLGVPLFVAGMMVSAFALRAVVGTGLTP